jgi:hypothetical protein
MSKSYQFEFPILISSWWCMSYWLIHNLNVKMEKLRALTILLVLLAYFYVLVQSKDVKTTTKPIMTSAERDEFNEWKLKNNKTYSTPEKEEKAAKNFIKSKRKSESFNNQTKHTRRASIILTPMRIRKSSCINGRVLKFLKMSCTTLRAMMTAMK